MADECRELRDSIANVERRLGSDIKEVAGTVTKLELKMVERFGDQDARIQIEEGKTQSALTALEGVTGDLKEIAINFTEFKMIRTGGTSVIRWVAFVAGGLITTGVGVLLGRFL